MQLVAPAWPNMDLMLSNIMQLVAPVWPNVDHMGFHGPPKEQSAEQYDPASGTGLAEHGSCGPPKQQSAEQYYPASGTGLAEHGSCGHPKQQSAEQYYPASGTGLAEHGSCVPPEQQSVEQYYPASSTDSAEHVYHASGTGLAEHGSHGPPKQQSAEQYYPASGTGLAEHGSHAIIFKGIPSSNQLSNIIQLVAPVWPNMDLVPSVLAKHKHNIQVPPEQQSVEQYYPASSTDSAEHVYHASGTGLAEHGSHGPPKQQSAEQYYPASGTGLAEHGSHAIIFKGLPSSNRLSIIIQLVAPVWPNMDLVVRSIIPPRDIYLAKHKHNTQVPQRSKRRSNIMQLAVLIRLNMYIMANGTFDCLLGSNGLSNIMQLVAPVAALVWPKVYLMLSDAKQQFDMRLGRSST
ncbi:hypothetical protein B0H19DRAFT_1071215 [Mycena capillaripes]|nr:hypothetical protein B0H19DRAFT_1071215 [Mycena capillaripes]